MSNLQEEAEKKAKAYCDLPHDIRSGPLMKAGMYVGYKNGYIAGYEASPKDAEIEKLRARIAELEEGSKELRWFTSRLIVWAETIEARPLATISAIKTELVKPLPSPPSSIK